VGAIRIKFLETENMIAEIKHPVEKLEGELQK
jgi:hypothetical protein